MNKKNVVVPVSGGQDSVVLLHHAASLGYKPHAITFDYGQRHKREIRCAEYQIETVKNRYDIDVPHRVIDVSFIKSIAPTSSLTNDNINTPIINEMAGDAQPASYVAFRNMIFASIACSYAEANDCNYVWYGSAQADSLAGYWDSSPEWVEKFAGIVALNRKVKIHFKTPLIDLTKADIVRLGIKLVVDFRMTHTCYSGNEIADATTPSSSLRLRGFIDAGYRDPIQYIQQDKINAAYEKAECKEIIY